MEAEHTAFTDADHTVADLTSRDLLRLVEGAPVHGNGVHQFQVLVLRLRSGDSYSEMRHERLQ